MIVRIIFCFLMLLSMNCFAGKNAIRPDNNEPNLPYLGQDLPGTTPKVFAPDIISTAEHEYACTFSPDGREFYFSRGSGQYNRKTIMVTRLEDDGWSEPEQAFMDFESECFEPHITCDGKKMFFMGFNEVSGHAMPDIDVFYSERQGQSWGEIKHMGEPFNPHRAMYISSTLDGTIYTTDSREMDIVRSRFVDGEYQAYENLAMPINTAGAEMYPFIAPDESYLLFCKMSQDGGSILVSFRAEDDSWTEPQKIETGMPCGCPSVSPDGKYLFFVSGRPKGDIYWVDMKCVEDLKP